MALIYKFNPQTGLVDLVPEDWTLQFNAFTGKMEFAPPGATLRYNVANGRTAMRSASSTPQFIPMSGEFELGEDNWEAVYDPVNNRWVKRPKT